MDAWPVYDLVTEKIISWTEAQTMTLVHIEHLSHALVAKRAAQRRADEKAAKENAR